MEPQNLFQCGTREQQQQQGGVLELPWKISDQSFDRSCKMKSIALQVVFVHNNTFNSIYIYIYIYTIASFIIYVYNR